MAAKKGRNFTRIQLQFLREQYQVLTDRQLHIAFNKRFHQDRAYTSIRAAIRNHRFTCGNNKAKGYQPTLMNEKQCAWIEQHYVDISQREITYQFNRKYGTSLTVRQMKTFIKNRGFKSGRTGCYPKGHVPANKGLRRPPGWSPGRMAETQFKPGPRLDLRYPIGHERLTIDGYITRKYDVMNPHTGVQGYYQEKHRMLWIEANGPVPPSHIITFIDDDRTHCFIENLECIPRGEQARRNKMKYLEAPAELRPSIKALAKLQHYTGKRQRQSTRRE